MKPSQIRDRERDRDEEEETEDEGRPSLAFRAGRLVGRGLRAARRGRQRVAESLRRRGRRGE